MDAIKVEKNPVYEKSEKIEKFLFKFSKKILLLADRFTKRFNVDLLRWQSLFDGSKSNSSLQFLFSTTELQRNSSFLYALVSSKQFLSFDRRSKSTFNHRKWRRTSISHGRCKSIFVRVSFNFQRKFLSIFFSGWFSLDRRRSTKLREEKLFFSIWFSSLKFVF